MIIFIHFSASDADAGRPNIRTKVHLLAHLRVFPCAHANLLPIPSEHLIALCDANRLTGRNAVAASCLSRNYGRTFCSVVEGGESSSCAKAEDKTVIFLALLIRFS